MCLAPVLFLVLSPGWTLEPCCSLVSSPVSDPVFLLLTGLTGRTLNLVHQFALLMDPVTRILLCLLCSDPVGLHLVDMDTAWAEVTLGSHLAFPHGAAGPCCSLKYSWTKSEIPVKKILPTISPTSISFNQQNYGSFHNSIIES